MVSGSEKPHCPTAGLIGQTEPLHITYELTRQGRDALLTLAAATSYGMRYHPQEVSQDGRPRNIDRVLPGKPGALLGESNHFFGRKDEPAPRAEGQATLSNGGHLGS